MLYTVNVPIYHFVFWGDITSHLAKASGFCSLAVTLAVFSAGFMKRLRNAACGLQLVNTNFAVCLEDNAVY